MLVVAAAVFHQQGFTQIADLDEAYRGLGAVLGHAPALLFALALLASGLSSSSVGTHQLQRTTNMFRQPAEIKPVRI